ncbi:MAG: serine/threonine-protein kinase [Candidatus Marinimicrobia bacterium]|jgi:serine/threonine protein kinase|nr:serine/threonine-protein kinase [Candidatus Neomarinimicrobiota bacterium]
MTSDINKNQTVEHPHRWESGDKVQHFTILNFIASEPLGDNYLAKDTQLNRMVAIKRFAFNVDLDYSDELVNKLKKKFLDDVKLFSKWDHPNLVSIHYFDVDEMGIPYYVMEYVPKTMGHWIGLVNDETDEALETRSESFSPQVSIDIILGICKGLKIMHQEGICHYRISPNNVLITEEGIPKLVSFGIETGMRPELASKIQQKYVGIYSAPEQIRGDYDSIGPKSDMYTIGLLFFQLLTGKLPTGIIQKDNYKELGIQNEIQVILENILQEDPMDRPAQLSELIENLENLVSTSKTDKSFKRKYTIPIALAVIFLGVFYGILSKVDSVSEHILVQTHFTPMIPASIYENLEPLGQFIFWTNIENNSPKEIQVELQAKFKGLQNDWDQLAVSIPANTDTMIGLNPYMNILEEKYDLRTNRNYYIDWKVLEKKTGFNNKIIQPILVSEGSERIVMLALGSIDWKILQDVYSITEDRFSPFSLIASWIIPKDAREILSKTNMLYNSAVVGYQKSLFESYTNIKGLEYRDIIRHQTEQIYRVLKKEYQIVYDGGGIGQTINFPQETLKYKSANCIELSVLFSSILLEAGIEPVIVIIPDHAFIGWQIWDHLHEYEFLETTVIGEKEKSFNDALLIGNKLAEDYGLEEMINENFNSVLFDSRGIYQKSPRVEVFHISSLRNYRDKQGRQVYTAVPFGYEVN